MYPWPWTPASGIPKVSWPICASHPHRCFRPFAESSLGVQILPMLSASNACPAAQLFRACKASTACEEASYCELILRIACADLHLAVLRSIDGSCVSDTVSHVREAELNHVGTGIAGLQGEIKDTNRTLAIPLRQNMTIKACELRAAGTHVAMYGC